MTDFSETIDAAAASVEDLSEDLEAHLEDILGVGVTIGGADLRTSDEYENYFRAAVEIDGLEDELADRFDADGVSVASFRLDIAPTVPEGDPE